MRDPTRSSRVQAALGLGLDLLPWIGLAVGAIFVVPSSLEQLIPSAPAIIPAFIVATGGLFVLWRRTTTSFEPSTTQSRATPAVAPALSPNAAAENRASEEANEPSPTAESSRDALTGLANRTSFLTVAARSLEARGEEESIGLLAVTLDEFRDVTDSFGYAAGQELITTVATRIDDTVPASATAARIAEDTFAVLLPSFDEKQATEVGQDVLDSFTSPFRIGGHEVPIQASVGLAVRAADAAFKNAEEMLQASYSAMHHIQRKGGGQINVFHGRDSEQTRWLRRRERLRKAVREDELTVHYQPVVHLVSGEMVGAEALVRWKHPERGLLPPAAFIPLAEETGLVGLIDRWVFERALDQASLWTQSPDGPVDWVSVNISPQSTEGDLQEWCREKLRGAALADGGLHLEITERWALEDERTLRPLRDEGVRLSIDDFGTGYSSLRYLRSLDADVLKIDRQFIDDLGRDPKTTAIVQFLLNLSLRLDVEVVAEGVETKQQVDTLRELGCAMAQGFYFSEPVPPAVLPEALASSSDEPSIVQDGELEPA